MTGTEGDLKRYRYNIHNKHSDHGNYPTRLHCLYANRHTHNDVI